MAFLPENLPPLNNDPNESSEDESPMENPHHFRKGIMDHEFDCSNSLQFGSHMWRVYTVDYTVLSKSVYGQALI